MIPVPAFATMWGDVVSKLDGDLQQLDQLPHGNKQ